ncbi:ryanodine receptor [Penaeus vannamei]|uniref:Ryanodine receptor n=1 Tax=Penaeus vannamei TaxID=6689 RepID=A0A3R7MMB5_PENVA|nr:ryanodine receptor [Penaeus vannamei]
MTLIMPTASSRNRAAVMPEASAGGGKVKKKKRRADGKKMSKEKELASSLMVACLKRLLPVGLNLFAGREQELVQHCKEKFLAKVPESEILVFAKTQLTLPDKIDPSDAMNWQHTLYSRLGGGRVPREDDEEKKLVPSVDETVDNIVAMAKVLYGLHIIDHPQSSKEVWRSVVSIQRKRAVIACFRQTSLHMMPSPSPTRFSRSPPCSQISPPPPPPCCVLSGRVSSHKLTLLVADLRAVSLPSVPLLRPPSLREQMLRGGPGGVLAGAWRPWAGERREAACTPPVSRSGWRKLLSFARKRAAIACLRSVPFYNVRRLYVSITDYDLASSYQTKTLSHPCDVALGVIP